MGGGGKGGGYGKWGGGKGGGDMMAMLSAMMGPYGKGKGKGGGKGGNLRNFKSEQKVWIGGLPADSCSRELNMALKEYMSAAGKCQYVEVGKSGNGGAAFTSAEEAQQAIAMLNGSTFQDSVIQVDVWTKKDA